MQVYELDNMTKGWLVGAFEPTAMHSEQFEVAVKYYNAGDYEERHMHKIATEITTIVQGTVKMNDKEYHKGSIIVIEPGESTDFYAITDVITTVVKALLLLEINMIADMLNIVIPMAGRGSRFQKAGYTVPKPLIEVHSMPMIERVVTNLRPECKHKFIFIVQQEQIAKYDLKTFLLDIAPGSIVIAIDHVTEGAACTVLHAEEYINNAAQLMIANCDQYVACNINHYLSAMAEGNYDGFIMSMTAHDDKWSYIRFDDKNEIVEVVEKKVVSKEATVGIYNYKHGSDFVRYAHTMIRENNRSNNEFYVAPVYNYMLEHGQKIGFYNIGSVRNGMYGLGVPEDLEFFNQLEALP